MELQKNLSERLLLKDTEEEDSSVACKQIVNGFQNEEE